MEFTSVPGSNDVLESFLHDMDALDQQQFTPATNQSKHRLKKRNGDGPKNKTVIKKKQPSWLKRKQELQNLRQETQAMETRVVFLKMKKSLSTSGFEVEKKVALLEKKKCLDAQEENKQLKTKLKFYSRQYETFQKTLAEFQQKELERVISGDLRVEIATGKQVQMFGCHLFDTMEGRLDARFHELEHAFQVMQQPMTSTDTDIIQTKNEKRGAVEFTRLELLPFENSAISATMWSVIEAGKFPDGEHSIVRRRSGDSVAVSTRVTVQASCGEVVIIDTHSVMKRFVTPQGNAFITEACSDWNVNSPALGAWRHSTREEGCFVVRSYDASPSISQSRSFLSLHPWGMPYPINEVLISSFRQLTIARHQFVQNVLFDSIRS